MLVPYAKPPLTFDQQLDLLVGRGLVVADRPAAAATLSRISYYRLSAYCLPFKAEHGRFRPKATWEQVVNLQKISTFCGLPHLVLRSWLRTLTFVRNVCAHHGRLWNRELAYAPLMPKAKHGWRPEEIPNQKRLFCVLIILRHLLDGQRRGDAWQREVTELLQPIADFEPFRLSMGLPEHWEGHPRWGRVR